MGFRRGLIFAAASMGAFGAALLPLAARAEVLHLEGYVPAGSDGAAAISSIMVERFGGENGSELSLAIEDALRDSYLDGEPYFRLLPPTGQSDPDATMRGSASSETRSVAIKQKRKICVAEDDKGKCTKREDRELNCRKRMVRLDYSIRLIAYNGNLLFGDDNHREREDIRCPGDDDLASRDSVVREFTQAVADDLQREFVPAAVRREVRIMESRKGLTKDDSNAFKDAVRLTKTDEQGACAAFGQLLVANPDHVSTLFNVGLCAEQGDQRDRAQAHYRRVLELKRGETYALEGLQRLADLDRAEQQLAAHFGA